MNTPNPDQTMKLSECTGMLAAIARGMLTKHSAYYCTVDGKRTKVVKG